MAVGNGGQKMSQYSWFTVYHNRILPFIYLLYSIVNISTILFSNGSPYN